MADTSVKQFIINKLTQEQFNSATKNENELYLVTDDDTYATKNEVNAELNNKLSIQQSPDDAGKIIKVSNTGELELTDADYVDLTSSQTITGKKIIDNTSFSLRTPYTIDTQVTKDIWRYYSFKDPNDVHLGALCMGKQTNGLLEIKVGFEFPESNYQALRVSYNTSTNIVKTHAVNPANNENSDAIATTYWVNQKLQNISSGSGRNIGDIFYTTRKDNELNGAVECNGAQYNLSDYSGANSISELLQNNKLPYISVNEFDSQISSTGSCGYFGYGTQTSIPLYAWNNMISSGNYVYTKSQDPVADDPVYELSNNEISQVGTVVANESNGLRINFGSMTIAQNSRSSDNDTSYIETGTTTYFKVPKLNNVYIQADSANIGQHLSAGLPNITGTWDLRTESNYMAAGQNYSGAIKSRGFVSNISRPSSSGRSTFDHGINFDASRSSSIYGNSNTVQPETICYRPMLQLFNESTDTALATCTEVLTDISSLKSYDYVVESQEPTSGNGYTWYRLYKSGWVEQGGIIPAGQTSNVLIITIPIEFYDTNYIAFVTSNSSRTSAVGYNYVYNQTQTSFTALVASGSGEFEVRWQASGMSAQ